MRSVRWANIVLMAAVAGVAGCSGSSAPTPGPTPTHSATPVASATPTASPTASATSTPSPAPTPTPTATPSKPPLLTSYRQYDLPTSTFPFDIITASDGNVWFTEATGNLVSLEPSGVFKSSTPTVGASAGLYAALPIGLTIGSDGSIWVANENDGSLSNISLSGVLLGHYPIGYPAAPDQIAFGSDGNLWFTEDNNTSVVGRMTPAGAYVGFAQAGVGRLTGIVAAPDGNLWLVEPGKGVLKLTTAGVATFYADPTGRISGPLCLGSDGNLWAGTLSGSGSTAVDKISLQGAFTEYDAPGYLGYDVTAIYSADGFVYLVAAYDYDAGVAEIISQLQTDGTFVRQYTLPMTGQVQSVMSMTLGSDKNLYLTDYEASTIDVWVDPEDLQSASRRRPR